MGHVNFHENFRILNFFEDEINLEEIKDERNHPRNFGMNFEDQKFWRINFILIIIQSALSDFKTSLTFPTSLTVIVRNQN